MPFTEFEYYTGTPVITNSNFQNYRTAQTFIPQQNFEIYYVKLYLHRTGNPGPMTVSIRNTSGGKPSGGDLCSVSQLQGYVGGDAWYEFDFTTQVKLNKGTQYAIVLTVPGGDGTDVIAWWIDNAGTYPRGTEVDTSDGGTTWNINNTWDCLFQTWGLGMLARSGVLITS